MEQQTKKKIKDSLSAEVREVLSKFSDEDYLIIKPALLNLSQQFLGQITARKIMEILQNQFDRQYKDWDIKVLRVEFRTQVMDEDFSGKIISDPEFNNYKNNEFLSELLIDNDKDFFHDCLLSTQNNISDNQINYEEDEVEETFDNFQDQTENQSDVTLIDATKKRIKINKIQEINQMVQKLEKALNNVSKWEIQIYNIEEAPLDSKLDSPLTVTLRFQKKYLNNLLNFQFHLNLDSQQPVYINFSKAQIVDDKLQCMDYSVKMGKIPFKLYDLTFSYLQGEYLKDISIDDNLNKPFKLFMVNYFRFSDLQNELRQMQVYMMFHCDDSKLYRRVEFVINVLDKFLLRIEVDLVNCQYCHAISDKFGKTMYFKLLCPPNYSISLNTKRKFELFNVQQDWIRVDNILSNAYYNRHKNEIERLIMVNNSIIKANFIIEQGSKEEMTYKMVLNKLMQYNLLLSDEIDVEFKEGMSRGEEIDKLQKMLENSKLSFEQKYNILCIVSQNRISDINYLKQLISKICEYRLNQQDDDDRRERVLEMAFQLFSRYSVDLNFSVRQSELNKKNYLLFNRDLQRCDEDVINLLNKDDDKRIAMIKRVSLTPSGYLYNIKLPEESSVIIRQYYDQLNNFIRLHFEDENMEAIHGHYFITDYYFKQKLKNGMNLFDEQYRLLTWSASQLRGGSCWIFNYKKAQITRQNFIDSIGNFSTLNVDQVAKNAARLGQNFSSSKSIEFSELNIITGIDDKMGENGKLYTDGIGKISKNLIHQIRVIMKNPYISAIQIRLHGAKGVLLLNDNLTDNTIELRKSMVKFNPSLMNDGKYTNMISLLDYNKFRGGYLNRQIIILLVTLGIEDDVFMSFQKEYLDKIQNVSAKDSSIYKHFLVEYNGELQGLPSIIDNIRLMINSNLNENNNIFIKRVLDRLKRRGLMQLRTKCNILIDKAARVLGVIDDYDVLNEGEVVCIVMEAQDVKHMYVEGEIIVVRNPCLHPGDIRKVRALSQNEILTRCDNKNPFKEYYNCIVFPCKGNSIPAECAGGDLDGDIYFVSWDPQIIPKELYPSMIYDEEKKPSTNQVQHQGYVSSEEFFQEDKMTDFLLQYLNFDVLGKIDNSHLAFADSSIDYAKDSKCLRLAELHSTAVDYVKHGNKVYIPQDLISKRWPDFMEKDSIVYESQSILGKLYRDVLQYINQEPQPILNGYKVEGLPNIDTRFIYKFFSPNELAEVENQNNIYEDFYQNNYQQYFASSICKKALQCLNHIFENFDSLRKMYDIQNEYEIYTGYFTNFTQGEGTRLKRKLNVDKVQKRVILSLVQLKHEITKILSINNEERLAEISIIHFLMMYSPSSHENQLRNSLSLKSYQQQLFNAFDNNQEIYKLFSRLKNKFPLWYRGCSWFFFTVEILSFVQKKENQEVKEEELI
ncbi:unnamed protein product [Paramecium sonneborni]|uniref:RNA-dependent RNA polymerase n=1 Tax=Paramecium sonneborni TaxID=65129 RepID=A0A8S1RC27_9CILI|nr:unnamed protein product [Paramecium sonneborni]